MLSLSITAQAARLPVVGEDTNAWGTVLNEYLQISHNSNGTLKDGVVANSIIADGSVTNAKIQDVDSSKVTGLSAFVVANELNPSNATIFIPSSQLTDIGDIQKVATAFNSANFTLSYDSRTDRFGNANFTGLFSGAFDTRLATKSTTNLAEGTNLYFTNVRATDAMMAFHPTLDTSSLDDWNTANDTSSFNTLLSAASINTGQVTGLQAFVVANELNPSNATIFIPSSQLTDIGDIQKVATAFNSANFTALYDGRNDRFSNGNFTPLFAGSYDARVDRFGNSNFTLLFPELYDARTDRFSNTNFTTLLIAGSINTNQVNGLAAFVVANELNPSNATIQIGTGQVTGLSAFVQSNELNPSNATIEIGTGQVIGLSAFVQANELNPSNATIQIGTGQVTGLQAFVVANELNPSNSTIQISTGQVTGLSPFITDVYDARTDRFSNTNFTTLLSAGSINTDQITGLQAFVVANELNPSNATLQINPDQVTGLAGFVQSNELNPSNATIEIGTGQVIGLSAFVQANELNPNNATIQIGTGQITNLAGFVQSNELNPSNATIFIPSSQLTDIGDIQKAAPAFNSANFTALYDGRTDRFGNDNFTLLFPASYDARTDRFGLENYSAEYGSTGWKLANATEINGTVTSALALKQDESPAFKLANITALGLQTEASAFKAGNVTALGLQTEGAAFKTSNFSALYDARTDRFGNDNFTLLFPASYDARTDRFTNENFSTRLTGSMIAPDQIIDLTNYIRSKELNPSNATIQIGTLQVTGLASFFAGEYDARNDRFGNSNFTASFQSVVPLCAGTDKLTSSDGNTIICAADVDSGANLAAYNLGNFTSNYDARTDRFGNGNFTSLLTAATGVSVQAFDADLSDLADGSLTGTKVSPDFGSQNIVTTGTLTVGTSGTAITRHLSGTGLADLAAYPAGGAATACQQFNVSVTGAVAGDSVAVTPIPVVGGVEAYYGIIWSGWATADIVTVRACNVADAAADIAPQTWRADVWQH